MNTTDQSYWFAAPIVSPDQSAKQAAENRQAMLTKPPGSLGMLEQIAIDFAGFQGKEKPELQKVHTQIFAADHGVVDEGVSAFPQAVTAEMIRNFARGGAAISVLCREQQVPLAVANLGTVTQVESLEGVTNYAIGMGTANFAKQAAMSESQCLAALQAGQDIVKQAVEQTPGLQLFIGGEMGIGNTTSATAIGAAVLKISAADLSGAGTGLDAEGIAHKAQVVASALSLHQDHLDSPLDILQRLGGFEIAALAGAYIASAQRGIPSLVDGFITTAAALIACKIQPQLRPWLVFSHQSAEQGHRLLLEYLDAKPILQLAMRLGEGSGAMTALPIIRSALALHNQMATFEQAAVSNKL